MATHLDLEEQEQIDQLKHFWSRWGTPITGVLVVAFGGFAAWNGWQYWQKRQSVQAAGLEFAVDQALNVDVLPSQEEAGKDLGILNLANTVGQVLAPVVVGAIVLATGGLRLCSRSLWLRCYWARCSSC